MRVWPLTVSDVKSSVPAEITYLGSSGLHYTGSCCPVATDMGPAGPRQARAVVDSSHRPAMGRQEKWPRKPFQINSVSITGVFIKINYLGGCLPKTALLAGGRSEGRLEGTAQLSFESLGRFSHIQMCVSSPR